MHWLLLPLLLPGLALAAIDPYEFDDPATRDRYQNLIDELRCPKCQNQNIAGSDAPLAADLRQRVHDMLQAGHSDREIKDYMIQRYGDFVTYRPPVKPLTWPLWFGPFVLIGLVGAILAVWIRRRARRDAAPLGEQDRERLKRLLREHGEDRS